MRLTIIIKKGEPGYLVGQLKEFPAVFSQGKTVKELRSNIKDALELYFEDLREQYDPNGEMIAEEELLFI